MARKKPKHVQVYPPDDFNEDQRSIWALINQRRRQVLIHSTLYYRLDKIIVPDRQFDRWAYELVDLQRQYPEISETVPYHKDAFKAFDGTTGFDLPIEDPEALRKANMIYEYYDSHRGR